MMIAAACMLFAGAAQDPQPVGDAADGYNPPTIEETRISLGKWIETQQIISRERKDWQQGKEILLARLDLVKQEIAALEEKISQAESTIAEASARRDALVADNDQLKAVAAQLTESVRAMESDVRQLLRRIPDPIRERIEVLVQRMPEDSSAARVSVAERFQNVLGILNELNKANNEITVSYEVHNLGDGKPSEVKAIYVGLAQAYYVSARGEAGIGRPSDEGWTWQPSRTIAADVLMALEILQGKHTPAFVPLPVTIQ